MTANILGVRKFWTFAEDGFSVAINMHPKDSEEISNSVETDQFAPIRSGSPL